MTIQVGDIQLATPLIAASGTVASVWEWAEVAQIENYGAAVAKSVSPEPWEGRQPPRMAPTAAGMLNGIGIQNPGIDAWVKSMEKRIKRLAVPVWGSAVAGDPPGFLSVAKGLETAGVSAIEVNLSCPNLDDGQMFSFSAERSAEVVDAVSSVVAIPVGAKLSPDTPDIVGVASAVSEAGADFVVLTNTARGFAISVQNRKPAVSGGVAGYSGPGLKPISMRCVYEVSQALPSLPIVGCGGVVSGSDVVEYMVAGASAVQAGTVHFAEPKAGKRIMREFKEILERLGVANPLDLVRAVDQW